MKASTRAAGITVHVPRDLRAYCQGAAELVMTGANVQEIFDQLERSYPGLYRSLCDETASVRRHVNLFVNSAHIRDREGLATPLVPGDVVTIVPAVSGG